MCLADVGADGMLPLHISGDVFHGQVDAQQESCYPK